VEIFAKDTAIGAPALDNTGSREPKLLLYVLTCSVHFAGCNGSQAPEVSILQKCISNQYDGHKSLVPIGPINYNNH
jgi:hypothetical protein